MERITRKLSLAEVLPKLDRLLERQASLDTADFTRCRLRHEKLTIGPNGAIKIHQGGQAIPPMCTVEIRQNRPVCPHHSEFANNPGMIPDALDTMSNVANTILQLRIQDLHNLYKKMRSELLALDTKRNLLSQNELQARSKPHFNQKKGLDFAKASQAIDARYDVLFAQMQKIHTETRALVEQAICEISGLPHELQPAL